MKINIDFEHVNEPLNNFTLANAIYQLCSSEDNDLDISALCGILREEDRYQYSKQEEETRRPRYGRY